MTELTSKTTIVAKGMLVLFLVVSSAGPIVVERPTLRVVLLLAVLIWASARFYYFLFYVLETYVDPRLRYSGVFALVSAVWRRPRS